MSLDELSIYVNKTLYPQKETSKSQIKGMFKHMNKNNDDHIDKEEMGEFLRMHIHKALLF